ncbi:hypothetical protein [Streptomyces sp. NPDC057909]|uniref:hypothetical protein n=1 Tax=Streptomyces sp. NPDC057909 TaxID=3346277 RepID=UPI0036EEDA3E
MDIASELPAVVISRLLGFHQSTGDNWTRESQGFGADYAAELSRRPAQDGEATPRPVDIDLSR